MPNKIDYQYEVDVLIAGGALTGMWAGIRAKEIDPSARVYVIDKASAGKSGCVAFAGGDISYVTPEDDLEALIDRYVKNGDGLAETDWIEMALVESYDRVKDMSDWGVPFERDETGRLKRYAGRGGGALAVVMPGYKLIEHIRSVALEKGVKFIDRVMLVDILKDTSGAVSGAWGYNPQTEETYLFKSTSVIISTGPNSFKASYIGHRMVTGDGVVTAYRHGAELMGMEFAVGHNTGPRDYDISGLARFVALGGKFTNRLGVEFMEKYDAELKNKANWGKLAYAMTMEVREGRGPVYFDLLQMNQESLELSRRIIPHTFMTLERAGIDITKQKVEWIPCFQGSQPCAAGIVVTKNFSTNLPGLFVAGDAGARRWYGAEAGYHGINLTWCCISGYHAGESAVKLAKDSDRALIDQTALDESLDFFLKPLNRSQGLTPKEANVKIQQVIIPPEVAVIKNKLTLQKAIAQLTALKQEIQENIVAPDGHELVKAIESKNMVIFAEMIVRSALLRKESRGCHFRDDYPEKNDAEFRRWSYLKQGEDGQMQIWHGPLC